MGNSSKAGKGILSISFTKGRLLLTMTSLPLRKAIPLIPVKDVWFAIAPNNSTIVISPSPITTASAYVLLRKYSGSGDGP